MATLLLLGGPNGVGKTTAARTILPRHPTLRSFLNADEIARGLSPFDPAAAALAAGRILLQRLKELIAQGEDFALESTLSGQGHARSLRAAKAAGYEIDLLFFTLPTPDDSVHRVAARVAQGGHHVPSEDVRRRWKAGLRLLPTLYAPLADAARIYDNHQRPPRLIALKELGGALQLIDVPYWRHLQEVAHA